MANVLLEADEIGMLLDWAEGELRIVFDDASSVLNLQEHNSEDDYRRALLICDRLQQLFKELTEIGEEPAP